MIVRNLKDLKKAMLVPKETERLEFKQSTGAKIDWHEVSDYCAVISNEGGGSFVLGVTDKLPRKFVGVGAAPPIDIDEAKKNLRDWTTLRVDICKITEGTRTAYSFIAPCRPPRRPISSRAKYQVRAGSHLRTMTPDELATILSEGDADFSGNLMDGDVASLLDPAHIERFRAGWIRKEERKGDGGISAQIQGWSTAQLLETADLVFDGKPTFAALILLGKKRALTRYLPHSEIIFEYRAQEGATREYQHRHLERDGFLASGDVLWSLINRRNDARSYQEGLFRYSLLAFDELTIREATCNAVCHRDYREQGSIFIRQYPMLLEVESPGSCVVPLESMLTQSKPRNRRLAEAMERCGLVERSGQGVDLMYEQCVRNSRPLPDWKASDEQRVICRVRGEVTDPKIIRFFERVNSETLRSFSGEDFLAVDLVRRKQPLPDHIKERAKRLVSVSVLERAGPGFRLSGRLMAEMDASESTGSGGERVAALAKIQTAGDAGVSVAELMKEFGRGREQIRWMLSEFREARLAHPRGKGAGARWYHGPENGGD